jgi:hypothetical protein
MIFQIFSIIFYCVITSIQKNCSPTVRSFLSLLQGRSLVGFDIFTHLILKYKSSCITKKKKKKNEEPEGSLFRQSAKLGAGYNQ